VVHGAIRLLPGPDRPMTVTTSAASGARGQRLARLQQADGETAIEKCFHFARYRCGRPGEAWGLPWKPPVLHQGGSRLGRTYSSRHGLKEVRSGAGGCELDKQPRAVTGAGSRSSARPAGLGPPTTGCASCSLPWAPQGRSWSGRERWSWRAVASPAFRLFGRNSICRRFAFGLRATEADRTSQSSAASPQSSSR